MYFFFEKVNCYRLCNSDISVSKIAIASENKNRLFFNLAVDFSVFVVIFLIGILIKN